MTTLITETGAELDSAEFKAAVDALAEAGIQHAQIRAHYAEAVLTALTALRPTPCLEPWDERTVCALPHGHRGWHASAPRIDDEGFPVAGSTWTPRQEGSDYRMRRS